jgi:hypothetical protein
MTLSTNKRRPIIIGPDTPLDPKETDLWINTTNNKIYRYDGSTFAVVSEAITQAYVQSASAYALSQATSQVNAVIDAAPGALNTLNELAAALNDDANFATTILGNIDSASVNNQWYTDYRVESASGALIGYFDSELGSLETTVNNNISLSETELVGIINTASVANTNYTDSEIIALNLTAGLVSASAAAVSYADSLTTTDVAEGTGLYFTNQRAIDAGSATYLTQSNAATTYLPKTGGTLSGNLQVDGNITVTGSTAYVNVTEFKVDDPMIYLAGNSSANLVDIGFVGNYNDGSYAHTGLVKDATDGRWKFFSSVESEPTGTIAFNEGILDPVAMGSASVIGNVNASAFIGDGSQLTGINLATKADKLNTFDAETANYTLILSNADQIVEMNVGSANTLTVPPNSSVAFPVGTELTVLQTNTGQTTITPGLGVTINGTPGLKLRAQWSSAVLIQRSANTWVAIGDLSA